MPFNIQGPELIVLLVIALLVLGPGKLPEVGAALGRSIREFRKAATDVKEATSIDPAKVAVAPPAEAPAAAPTIAPPAAAPAITPAVDAAPATPAPSGAGPSKPEAVAVAPGTSDTDSPAS